MCTVRECVRAPLRHSACHPVRPRPSRSRAVPKAHACTEHAAAGRRRHAACPRSCAAAAPARIKAAQRWRRRRAASACGHARRVRARAAARAAAVVRGCVVEARVALTHASCGSCVVRVAAARRGALQRQAVCSGASRACGRAALATRRPGASPCGARGPCVCRCAPPPATAESSDFANAELCRSCAELCQHAAGQGRRCGMGAMAVLRSCGFGVVRLLAARWRERDNGVRVG